MSCVEKSPEPRYQLQTEQISIFRITKRTLEFNPDRDTSVVRMSRPGYKTKSDTMLLRRLINNLKERGSEVAGELERKAHNFLTDVQMKRKPVEVILNNSVDAVLNFSILRNECDIFKISSFVILCRQRFL